MRYWDTSEVQVHCLLTNQVTGWGANGKNKQILPVNKDIYDMLDRKYSNITIQLDYFWSIYW